MIPGQDPESIWGLLPENTKSKRFLPNLPGVLKWKPVQPGVPCIEGLPPSPGAGLEAQKFVENLKLPVLSQALNKDR